MDKLFKQRRSENQEKGTDWRHWFKNLQWGVAACLVCGMFKGPVPATSRYVQDRGYTPYQMLLFNDALTLLSALSNTVLHRADIRPADYKQVGRFIFQGLTRFSSVLCLFMSYGLVPPAQVEAIWSASMPVFVLMLSSIFLKEIPTCTTILGSLWCIAGVILLGYGSFVNKSPSTDTKDVVLGILLTVTGASIHAMLDVGAKNLLDYVPRAKLVTYTYAISTACAGLAACFTTVTWKLEPVTAAILAVSCVSHGLGILFFYLGLKLVEVNAVTALLQFSAFTAYGLQWAILGFAPTILDGLGLTCVLIGTSSIAIWEALVRWKKEKHKTFMKELDLNVTSSNKDS